MAAYASVPSAQPASVPTTAPPSPAATTVPAPGTVPPPAGTLGTVPPAKPAANCAPPWAKALTGAGALRLIDYCRAQQGVGPLRLPSNFARLSVPEQMLVIIDLERVNRGEVPVAGLTAPLDHLAQQAAATGSDPAIGFGDIWEGGPISTAQADYGWMYDDGYAGSNVDCTAPGSAAVLGPPGHHPGRRRPRGLVAGAGFQTGLSYGNSYAFGLAGYAPGSRLVFSWAGELRYFQVPPGIEPLVAGSAGPPVLASP